MTALYRDIEQAETNLESVRAAYLRRWGWRQTCNTPGSFWLWRRDFADIDQKQLEWWQAAASRANREGRGAPSKPVPFGVITADTETAVKMTAKELDDFKEEQGGAQ